MPGNLITHRILQYHRISKKDPGPSSHHNHNSQSLYTPCILHYDLDETGMCLVTVDVRKGEELPTEYSLKFWEYNLSQQEYILIAQMNSPHGHGQGGVISSLAISHTAGMTMVDAMTASGGGSNVGGGPVQKRRRKNSEGNLAITSAANANVNPGAGAAVDTVTVTPINLLDAQPSALLVATASLDGTVKVWQRLSAASMAASTATTIVQQQTGDSNKQQQRSKLPLSSSALLRYKCLYSFTYRPGMLIHRMVFSQDNSTLAIPYGNLLTFWDPIR